VIRAILLLSWWQLRNAVRTSLTDVRKLIPLLVFGFFVVTQVGASMFLSQVRVPPPPGANQMVLQHVDTIETGLFILIGLAALAVLDYGFTGGFLTFPLADVDYLFPAPISRKVVLAQRLLGKTALSFLQSGLFFYVLIWRMAEAFAPGRATLGAGFAALCALFFCLGGYTNLAFALKLIFGFGREGALRRWSLGAFLVVVALLGWTYWQGGWPALTSLGKNAVVTVLFYPCRLAAEATISPLAGGTGVGAALQLLLFYGATLAVLFSRNENFYEAALPGSERAARMLQAVREQNWSAMFAIGQEDRRRRGGKERPYTVPPFGRGGMALLWAHLCAAAKRPLPNFIGPVLGGIALPLGALRLDARAAPFIVLGVSCYLLFILTMTGVQVFRQAIQRQIVRPLPIPAWQAVAADIAPRLLSSCLFCVTAGLTLLATGLEHADRVAPALLFGVPAGLVLLYVLQYLLALWYPDAQDKLQQLLAGFISLFLNGAAITLMVILLAVPLVLRAPLWLTLLVFLVPVLGAAAGLLAVTAAFYRRFEPKQ
jgi:hypothetical protein